jgi:hypothetical protein
MPKLQSINKSYGGKVYTLVIPKEIIEEAQFEKGDEFLIQLDLSHKETIIAKRISKNGS